MDTYCKILNEIASIFDMDQWNDQVNPFTDAINKQLNVFVHNTKYNDIYILENSSLGHDFPQFDFYKERCYVNGEKVILDKYGTIENKWKNKETVNVIIKNLDKLGESCAFMFYRCFSLVSVPWFNTNMVTDMTDMFHGCRSLTTVPKFNTSGVTHMSYMFSGCNSLVSVPLFDTSGVTDMENMFLGCSSLSEETKKAWSSVYNFIIHK